MYDFMLFLFLPWLIIIIFVLGERNFIQKNSNLVYTFQKTKHIFVYLIEIYTIVYVGLTLIVYIKSSAFPFWTADISKQYYFTTTLSIWSVYQIIIFIFLKIADSADLDSKSSYIKFLKVVILGIEEEVPDVESEFQKAKKIMEDTRKIMFTNEEKSAFKTVFQKYDLYKREELSKQQILVFLKVELISTEHKISMYNFSWYSSFVLRILK